MQIDWITVAAQVLNFLLLLWILRRLVYAPLSAAMAAREARLRESFARAETEAEAARRHAEALDAERAALERRRAELVAAAESEAEALERKLLEAARAEADRRREAWRAELARDRETLVAEMRRRAAESLPTLARRALADLASAPLERAIAERFAASLASAPEETATAIRSAAEREGGATLETAFPLEDDTEGALARAVAALLGEDAALRFARNADLLCGVRLRAGGKSMQWSLDGWVDRFAEDLDAALCETAPDAPSESPA